MKFRKFLSLYFFTIKDFTPVNVFKRIKYELKIYFLKINFSSFIKKYRVNYKEIKWNSKTLIINSKKFDQFDKTFFSAKYIEIEFLNKKEQLRLPIDWNISSVSR